jgi:hypothetical protein
MLIRRKWIAVLIILVSLSPLAAAQNMLLGKDLNVVLELGALTEAEAPRILGGELLLTYAFDSDPESERVHTVQAAFSHENYSVLHPFLRNENGVFLLLTEIPNTSEPLLYRLIVDGTWTTDPNNPHRSVDQWGVPLSEIVVRPQALASRVPVVHDGGEVEFVLRAAPNSRVSIAGSFNAWDPFMTPLFEIEPGVYRRRLRVGAGEHFYYYIVDGLRLPDPENDERRWNRSGRQVSVLRVE